MSEQVLRNTSANLEVTFYSDETATSADGAVTVTVTRADGSTLVSGAATTSPGTGRYRYTLAPQSNLNQLTLAWTGTFSGNVQTVTTYAEIVGGFYVTLAELRAQPNLSDAAKFTTAELVAARRWFEQKFESYTRRAFVPRYKRERVGGTGSTGLSLSGWPVRAVISVRDYTDAATYTSYSVSDLADLVLDDIGGVRRSSLGVFTAGTGNLVVEYEHGLLEPPPELKEAALTAIRDHLLNSNVGHRQVSVQTEQGVERNLLAGPGHPFAIDTVDEVANSLRALVVV